MDDAHRSVIQSNYASLVEQTDLDLMVSALYEKGVFSDHMIERYRDTRNDVRHRKRQLYMDVMTRGPYAFRHLIDALTEAGYWDIARELDPESYLHTNAIGNTKPQPTPSDDFISISTERRKTQAGLDMPKNPPQLPPQLKNDLKPPKQPSNSDPPMPDPDTEIPHFHIKKCTKFVEDDDSGIKVYRTRGRPRGILIVFSYIEFLNNVEEPRAGGDVDNIMLKYLFHELGFKVFSFKNLTKEKTLETLKSLNTVLEGAECVFIVVSSHGYGRAGTLDNDFRCFDGKLMSSTEFLEYFNNKRLHVLQGVPKVFIFQICRGSTIEWKEMLMPMNGAGAQYARGVRGEPGARGARPDGAVFTDEPPPPRPPPPALRPALGDEKHRERIYSDILIAHSTVPGHVSWRDNAHGSWYIQALCEVFAAHAHDTHVEELFTRVDQRLAERFRIQTSSVDRWGFNRRLYLHPGLYE